MSTAAENVVTKSPGTPPKLGNFFWRTYEQNLEKRPLLTKAVMASFIFFASDSTTQYLLPGESNLTQSEAPDGGLLVWRWDASRALSGAGFGVVATSWLHYWWGFLETAVGRAIPVQRYRLANTLTKVAIDQLLGMFLEFSFFRVSFRYNLALTSFILLLLKPFRCTLLHLLLLRLNKLFAGSSGSTHTRITVLARQ